MEKSREPLELQMWPGLRLVFRLDERPLFEKIIGTARNERAKLACFQGLGTGPFPGMNMPGSIKAGFGVLPRSRRSRSFHGMKMQGSIEAGQWPTGFYLIDL